MVNTRKSTSSTHKGVHIQKVVLSKSTTRSAQQRELTNEVVKSKMEREERAEMAIDESPYIYKTAVSTPANTTGVQIMDAFQLFPEEKECTPSRESDGTRKQHAEQVLASMKG